MVSLSNHEVGALGTSSFDELRMRSLPNDRSQTRP